MVRYPLLDSGDFKNAAAVLQGLDVVLDQGSLFQGILVSAR